MGDPDILGFWIIYLLIAAAVIAGSYYWIDSHNDDKMLQHTVVHNELSKYLAAIDKIEGESTLFYSAPKKFRFEFRDNELIISNEKVTKRIPVKDSEKYSLEFDGTNVDIKKNE